MTDIKKATENIWPGLAATFGGILIAPFIGWIGAKIDQTVWRWFLSEYGDGPSIRAWFGIGMLFALFTSRLASNSEKKDDQGWLEWVIGILVSSFLMQLGLLVTAGWIRLVWGWT